MAKKTFYSRPKKNSKLQQLQNEFDNYKRKNEVNIKAVLEARQEAKRLRAALEKIAYTASIKELYEAEAFADRVLRGEST